MNKFLKNISTVAKCYVPHLRFKFYDNPYMIGVKSKIDDYCYEENIENKNLLDKYYLELPIHLYIINNNNIEIFSLLNKNNFYRYDDIFLKNNIKQFYPNIENLIKDYTVNNQNIKVDDSSLELIDKEVFIENKNKFPIFIYPQQIKSNQYKINKSLYDIKTILRFNSNECINNLWKKVT